MVRSLLTLVSVFSCCSLVQAGLYGGKEPVPGPACEAGKVEPLVFGHFHLLVMQFTLDALNPAGSVHRELVQKRDALLAKAKRGPLSVPDARPERAVSALKQYEEAVQLLTPLAEREARQLQGPCEPGVGSSACRPLGSGLRLSPASPRFLAA